MRNLNIGFFSLFLGAASIAEVNAAEILVTNNISTSTTWTANNTYNLTKVIYVLPGATLTIEAGTVIASHKTSALNEGTLLVARGAQINILGTVDKPVIMTSKEDVATWASDLTHPTGKNPKTGVWRATANEWGNLTILGKAYIGYSVDGGTLVPSGTNENLMENVLPTGTGDHNGYYGGDFDDDDSGTIHYLSIRYGGTSGNAWSEEPGLNALSLGGVGRGTDIHHVEIMNNVYDGIGIFGGTVNLKNISVWNVGNDSITVEEGWRGKAQTGLIVQGGALLIEPLKVRDAFDLSGANQEYAQPVSTACIYNFTVIGQPGGVGGATHWSSNARCQFRNCIFMDNPSFVVDAWLPEYGTNGTLSWPNTWTTNWNVYSTVNPPPNPADFYKAQTSGKLIEFTDNIFFRNNGASAYTEATAQGVFQAANNNVLIPGSDMTNAPVQSVTYGVPVYYSAGVNLPMASLDPRPKNEALSSAYWAPKDGFFSQSHFRGGFAKGQDWLNGWTASQAFGITPAPSAWVDMGLSLCGTSGDSNLQGTGNLTPGGAFTVSLNNALPNTPVVLVIGLSAISVPLYGGVLYPNADVLVNLTTDAQGQASAPLHWPGGVTSQSKFYFQCWYADAAGVSGFAASNGLMVRQP